MPFGAVRGSCDAGESGCHRDDVRMIASCFLLTGSISLSLLLFAGTLSIIPGRLKEIVRCAPTLDLVVSVFTWIPWVVGLSLLGWRGLVAAVVAQFISLKAWCLIHELANREAARGPRIVEVINRLVGPWRNHLALWVTAIALPGFLMIRLIEIVVYWTLPLLLNFPKYRQAEWVNCSRQKFDGLIGHDLIWCLYCDWMTGVYSLGAEMLRNVESFWCPIRFYDGKKCENCNVDFPDITNGWVKPGATMKDVTDVLEEKYSTGERAWFGHPVRLTVKGHDARGISQTDLPTNPKSHQ